MKENWVYRRGDLYLANLGVPVGSKQGGVRPVVVLQNDVGNYYAPTITIAPLTSKIEKKRKQPTHFFLRKAKGLAKPSMVSPFCCLCVRAWGNGTVQPLISGEQRL